MQPRVAMKVFSLVLACSLPLLGYTFPATEQKSIAAVDVEDEAELDSDPSGSSKDSQIEKRSGSFDYVAHLKSGLLSSIGHASASIASGSSGGSSGGGGGGGGGYKSHDSAHHGNSVGYDPWSFKKSVLNTIFQAVKAITGGVTALKGQLIKGSGYALSAGGNLVAASGDKVTDVGKSIISSVQVQTHPAYGYGHSDGGGSVHPFAKFSSLSGASSSSSSGGGGKHPAPPGPVVHTETITTYEIPAGHGSYGPPSKPPSFSSATHQYLPSPPSSSYGGAPFSGGHAAFEAPPSNYLPSGYGPDGHDDFNIYGRHKKLTDEEARKAAAQLQEILSMLPDGKTEYTASKTVTLDTLDDVGPQSANVHNGLPSNLGPLESLSHTESITAAYGARPQENPSDVYHQMAKKQLVEELYIKKHPNEGYDYERPQETSADAIKYNNYHASKGNAGLHDLTPIVAALEVVKHKGPAVNQPVSTQFTIEKNVHKVALPGPTQFKYLSPVVQKSKYTYFDPAQSRIDHWPHNQSVERKPDVSYNGPVPSAYKTRRHAVAPPPSRSYEHASPKLFKEHDYHIQDPLLYNHLYVR